jgi:hypothetical protein
VRGKGGGGGRSCESLGERIGRGGKISAWWRQSAFKAPLWGKRGGASRDATLWKGRSDHSPAVAHAAVSDGWPTQDMGGAGGDRWGPATVPGSVVNRYSNGFKTFQT